MKNLLFLLLFAYVSVGVVFASVLDMNVKLKYSKNEQELKSLESKVSGKMGEEFLVESDSFKALLNPKDFTGESLNGNKSGESVDITSRIYLKTNGKLEEIGQPRIILNKGRQATITIDKENGERLEMSVEL